MVITNRKWLILGVFFILIGVCWLIDGLQSHLTALRIIGVLCFLWLVLIVFGVLSNDGLLKADLPKLNL
jgi:hypothetical protein